ncbi:MAG: hypothetical protein P4M11_07185 [Candidatus Pacebacteria bacterium]|nr:hypothetical protein [Candidatus Paceibacterota bacterium]
MPTFRALIVCASHILSVMMDYKVMHAAIAEVLVQLEAAVQSVLDQLSLLAKRAAETKGEKFGSDVEEMKPKYVAHRNDVC